MGVDRKIPWQEHHKRMQIIPPDSDLDFYALTLTADAQNKIAWSSQSIFAGYEDSPRRWELRKLRPLKASFAEHWRALNYPYVLVHSPKDFSLFLVLGGNALIETSIVESKLPDFLKPQAVADNGMVGFRSLESVDATSLRKAPTPKLRMKILKRDERRCKICGRRPDDDVDLQLHVHHIRPSENRGLSEENNLITLCHTCHTGLDPHHDWSLFTLLPNFNESFDIDVDQERKELIEGINRYRKISIQMLGENQNKKD